MRSGVSVIARRRSGAYANVIVPAMHLLGLIAGASIGTIGWIISRMVRKAPSSRKWKAIGLLSWRRAASVPRRHGLRSREHQLWRRLLAGTGGFAQSRVRAIVQTRDGYIWLGTDGGLVRFNGESFTALVQTGALKDNEVWALQEDARAACGSAPTAAVSLCSRTDVSGRLRPRTGFPTT